MLSQGNSNISARLSRAKSTSSVHSREIPQEPQTIVVDTERRQALTAASVAYKRAMRLDQNETELAIPDMQNGLRVRTANDGGVRPTQSVRFTGPKAIPVRQRNSTTLEDQTHRQTAAELPMQKNCPSQWDLDRSGNISVASRVLESPPPASSSSNRKFEAAKPVSSSWKDPSIMASPGTQRGENGWQRRYFPSHNDYTLDEVVQPPELTAVPSRSILTVPFQPSTETSQEATVQMARDQLLQQREQKRLQGRTSFLNLRKRQSNKTFRRTVRSTSTNKFGNAIASPLSEPNLKPKSFANQAKSISTSLKNTIKRVFQHEKSQSELPTQQIDCQRAHFRDYGSSASDLDQDDLGISMPDNDMLDRFNNRSQSSIRMPVQLGPQTKPGSIRSVPSSEDLSVTKSRVTSWTDSSAANTLTRQQGLGRQRLSIIQEQGLHQPSSSAGRVGHAPRGGYAVFKKPMKANRSGDRSRVHVKTQRVFSALQKEMVEERLRKEAALDGRSSGEDTTTQTPSREVARSSSENTETSPDTIRETRACSQGALDVASSTGYTESVYSNNAPPDHTNDMLHPLRCHPVSHSSVNEDDQIVFRGYPREQTVGQKDGIRSAREPESKPLTMSECIAMNVHPFLNITLPAYDDDSTENDERMPKHIVSMVGNMIRARAARSVPSESNYSRTTSGNSPPVNSSFQSLNQVDSKDMPSTADFIKDDQIYHTNFALPPRERGTSSKKSRMDRKGSIASRVKKLGRREFDNMKPDAKHASQETRHKRERAYPKHNDNEVAPMQISDTKSDQTSADLQKDGHPRPLLMRKRSDQMIENYPLRFPLIGRSRSSDEDVPGASLSSEQEPNAVSQSGSNNERERMLSFLESQKLSDRPQASVRPFQSQKKHWARQFASNAEFNQSQYLTTSGQDDSNSRQKTRSTANGYSRSSPERLARLRSIQNSSIPTMRENVSYQPTLRQSRSHHSQTPSIGDNTAANSSNENIHPHRGTGSQQLVDSFLSKRNRKIRSAGTDDDDGDIAFV